MYTPRSQVTEGLPDRVVWSPKLENDRGMEAMIATLAQTVSETQSRSDQGRSVHCLGNTRWGGAGGGANREAEDAAELSFSGRHSAT